jgi:predicted AAA+ superfamily ATPase
LDPYGQLGTLLAETQKSGLPIVIDEVQRLAQITLALKRIVDRDRRPGQFVLTGSSDNFTTPKLDLNSDGLILGSPAS